MEVGRDSKILDRGKLDGIRAEVPEQMRRGVQEGGNGYEWE